MAERVITLFDAEYVMPKLMVHYLTQRMSDGDESLHYKYCKNIWDLWKDNLRLLLFKLFIVETKVGIKILFIMCIKLTLIHY